MKIKVIMDSGKEYINEKDKSVEEFIERFTPKQAFGVNYISLDINETVYINGSHISSIEVIEETSVHDDGDGMVLY